MAPWSAVTAQQVQAVMSLNVGRFILLVMSVSEMQVL